MGELSTQIEQETAIVLDHTTGHRLAGIRTVPEDRVRPFSDTCPGTVFLGSDQAKARDPTHPGIRTITETRIHLAGCDSVNFVLGPDGRDSGLTPPWAVDPPPYLSTRFNLFDHSSSYRIPPKKRSIGSP